MEHEDAFRAVKLPFPPQEYLCTWKLPDIRLKNNEDRQGEGSDGGVVEANGVLDLTAGGIHMDHSMENFRSYGRAIVVNFRRSTTSTALSEGCRAVPILL